MTNVRIYASELAIGDVLANGNTVVTVESWLYNHTVYYVESDGSKHDVWSFQPVALAEQTNCLYGGLKPGHTRRFCTAHSCY